MGYELFMMKKNGGGWCFYAGEAKKGIAKFSSRANQKRGLGGNVLSITEK